MGRLPLLLLGTFFVCLSVAAVLVTGAATGSQSPAAQPSPTRDVHQEAQEEFLGHLPQVSRDGEPPPLPTPPPTPEPLPGNLGSCTEPRGEGSNALPASASSVFRNCQVIAYYGTPSAASMGILGQPDREAMIEQLEAQAAEFDPVNGPRGVVTAFHLIVAVAQPTTQGTALTYLADEVIREWIDLAEEHDALLILDTQVAFNTVEAEVERLLPYLEDPRVHLALDPEWTMPPGVPPGSEIGRMHASDINLAQDMLQELVVEHRLPNKMLMVHQFTPGMIQDKPTLEDVADVDLVIDMDGWGNQGLKTSQYNRFVRDYDDIEHAGIKLYFDQEPDLMSPEVLNALDPEPDIVIYQ